MEERVLLSKIGRNGLCRRKEKGIEEEGRESPEDEIFPPYFRFTIPNPPLLFPLPFSILRYAPLGIFSSSSSSIFPVVKEEGEKRKGE